LKELRFQTEKKLLEKFEAQYSKQDEEGRQAQQKQTLKWLLKAHHCRITTTNWLSASKI
jgi:hypothetical protein